MTEMKPILREFLTWLEIAYGHAGQGAASEFAVEPPSETLDMAEIALDAAINGERSVLFGTDAPVKSVIAALVLRRAGITMEQVFQGNFSDDQFEALADALRTVKTSKLLVDLAVEQPVSNTGTDH